MGKESRVEQAPEAESGLPGPHDIPEDIEKVYVVFRVSGVRGDAEVLALAAYKCPHVAQAHAEKARECAAAIWDRYRAEPSFEIPKLTPYDPKFKQHREFPTTYWSESVELRGDLPAPDPWWLRKMGAKQ